VCIGRGTGATKVICVPADSPLLTVAWRNPIRAKVRTSLALARTVGACAGPNTSLPRISVNSCGALIVAVTSARAGPPVNSQSPSLVRSTRYGYQPATAVTVSSVTPNGPKRCGSLVAKLMTNVTAAPGASGDARSTSSKVSAGTPDCATIRCGNGPPAPSARDSISIVPGSKAFSGYTYIRSTSFTSLPSWRKRFGKRCR